MAYLLGSQFCIDSLRNDVADLQKVLRDVLSRVGQVPAMSWKFPDRLACDLDINDQLERHKYSDVDDEDNQVSHIVLLELVIDRYNIIFQCLTKFLEILISSFTNQTGNTDATNIKSSVGLVATKYWNKILQLHKISEKINAENRSNIRRIKELEMESVNRSATQTSSASSLLSRISENDEKTETSENIADIDSENPDRTVTTHKSVKSTFECSVRATQTVETVFVPCESCSNVQKCLKDVSQSVSIICKSQNLPSSLERFRAKLGDLQNDWLSSNDVVRWRSDLQKDLMRLEKNFLQMTDKNKKLENENISYIKDNQEKQRRIDHIDVDIQKEKDKQVAIRTDFEGKLKDLGACKDMEIKKVEQKNKALQNKSDSMAKEISILKSEIATLKGLLSILDKLKALLSVEGEDICYEDIEKKTYELKQSVFKLNYLIQEKDEELKRETLKSASLLKQNGMLMTKHEKAVNRLTELSTQKEELEEQIEDLEESRDAMESQVKSISAEKVKYEMMALEHEKLVATLTETQTSLTSSLHKMETRLEELQQELAASEDEKRLILEYPDLNGPVNAELQDTGDIVLDMEKQVQANELRVDLLQQQNSQLRTTVESIRRKRDSNASASTSSGGTSNPLELQVQTQQEDVREQARPLWGQFPEPEREDPPPTATSGRRWSLGSDGGVPLPPINPQESSREHLQSTSEVAAPRRTYVNPTSSVPVNTGRRPASAATGRPPSGRPTTAGNPSSNTRHSGLRSSAAANRSDFVQWSTRGQPVYPCKKCGKSFKIKSDLEIHKHHCTKR